MADTTMGKDGALVREWCEFFGTNSKVIAWLKTHPVPAWFHGTAMEYAYWWMPYEVLSTGRSCRK